MVLPRGWVLTVLGSTQAIPDPTSKAEHRRKGDPDVQKHRDTFAFI